MTDSIDDRPFSHVKHLREIRDRIGRVLEHMTPEEAYRWHWSREHKNSKLRALMSRVKSPPSARQETDTKIDE